MPAHPTSDTQPRSLTARTVAGVMWTFSGATTQSVVSLLVLVILARFLKPAEFGVFGAALVVISLSQLIGQLGIGAAIVQLRNLSTEDIHVGFTLSLIFAIGMAAVVFQFAPHVADFFGMPELQNAIRVLTAVFPVTGLAVVGQALMQREMEFKRIAAIDCLSYCIGYGLVAVSLGVAGWGMWALVWAQVAQATVNAALVLLSKPRSVGFSMSTTPILRLLDFGTGFSLARVANYVATQADNIVVGKWLGADALGVYGRAYQCMAMPANFVGNIFDKVLFAAMATLQADARRLARAFSRATGVVALLMLPLSGLLIILAPEIVRLVLGPEWLRVVPPFQALCVVLVFRAGYKLGHSLARATGAVYETAWRQWVYAAAVIAGALVGLAGGVLGVAIGVAMAVVLNYLLTLHLSLKLVGLSWLEIARINFRHLTLAVVVSGSAYISRSLLHGHGGDSHPALVLLIAGISALAVLFVFWFLFRTWLGDDAVWLHDNAKRQLTGAIRRLRFHKAC